MRLISITRAEDGVVLGRDVMVGRSDGVPLLRAGVTLTSRYRDLLMGAGVSAIYVHDRASEGIEIVSLVDDETRAVATAAVSGAFDSARETMHTGGPMDPTRVQALQDVVNRILDQIEETNGAALALADLCSADGYTFQHSIDVTALGLLIGYRYFTRHGWVDHEGRVRHDRIDERLSTLGLGLLLHDIGKLVVPLGVLNKPGKLTAEEWAIMKTHPRAGVDMLDANSWNPLVRAIVLRHHERWNGSGYPDSQSGAAIHPMARIAAVADVYDAVTSARSYAPARPACDGVRVILEGSGTLFDPYVVEAFLDVAPPFPAGSDVKLTDGRRGIVVSTPEGALDRPVVRLLDGDRVDGQVSLLDNPELGIEGWEFSSPVPAGVQF